MKKSNILAAAFVVLSAASAAQAGNATIDFDNRTSGSVSFIEAIRDNAAVPDDSALPPAVPEAAPADSSPWLSDFFSQHGGIQTICQPMSPSNTWYEVVRCGGLPADWESMIANTPGQAEYVKAARTFHPGLQQKLRDILLGYCNTYPEFADAVLPMLNDGNAKITIHNGFVYIITGERIMRFSGATPSKAEKGASSNKWSLTTWGTAAEAAEAVYNAVNALNEYGSWPPVPDNGTADDYHGPALTVKPEDGVPVIYDNYRK
ncbi:MAG: hypothetical protein HY550_00330 [Elusimicrobia bacterium]|nr:hypothetical protein [Elusimicrobiota bacterium]